MTTFANALTLIKPPPVPPRPYGLFDVALGPMPFPNPGAMGAGIQYVPDTCEDDVFLYAMNCPAVSGSKTFSPIDPAVSGDPFGVITSYQCSSIGYSFDEARQRVLTRMQLREQRAVERRVWQGSPQGGIGGLPGLFQSATSLGAATCPTQAVQMLEQALADNAIVGGLIHARPAMSSHLSRSYQLQRPNARQINTWLGTPVAFGQGYDGTGPTGQAVTATTEWMYASGRVLIWQSDVDVPPIGPNMNLATNTVFTFAEKIFNVIVECGVWAVQVTRDCSTL
jgi:hypothetical protein